MLQFDDFTPDDPCCNLTISRQMPMLQFDIFMAIGSCCDLTISWEAVHPVISRFHGRWHMLQFDDFTPDDPCCNLSISRQKAHAVIWQFHGRQSCCDFSCDFTTSFALWTFCKIFIVFIFLVLGFNFFSCRGWGDSYDGRFFCIARFHGKIGILQHGAISILHLHFAHSARTQSSLFHFSSFGFQFF